MSAPAIELDPGGQALAAPAFTLSYSSVHLNGKLQATNIQGDLRATGSVTLAPLVLREFAPRFGMALPDTRDPRALAQLAASSDFSYDADGVRLEQLQAQLDDTKFAGQCGLGG